jgi:hypothetical protein
MSGRAKSGECRSSSSQTAGGTSRYRFNLPVRGDGGKVGTGATPPPRCIVAKDRPPPVADIQRYPRAACGVRLWDRARFSNAQEYSRVARRDVPIEHYRRDAEAVRDLSHADVGTGEHRLGGLRAVVRQLQGRSCHDDRGHDQPVRPAEAGRGRPGLNRGGAGSATRPQSRAHCSRTVAGSAEDRPHGESGARPGLLFAFVAGGRQQPSDDRAHRRIDDHERSGRASFEKILFSLRLR